MAKVWGNNNAQRCEQRRYYSNVVRNIMTSAGYRQSQSYERKPGIKVMAIEVYSKKGKEAAWEFLQKYNNEHLSGNGFSLETLEQWISEYENRIVQKAGKDDGYDR